MRPLSLPMLLVRVALAWGWAGLLALAGLWALSHGPLRFPLLGRFWLVGGITCLLMGQFVFAAAAADRLFPHVHPRVQAGVELTVGVGFLAGLCLMLAMVLGALT